MGPGGSLNLLEMYSLFFVRDASFKLSLCLLNSHLIIYFVVQRFPSNSAEIKALRNGLFTRKQNYEVLQLLYTLVVTRGLY